MNFNENSQPNSRSQSQINQNQTHQNTQDSIRGNENIGTTPVTVKATYSQGSKQLNVGATLNSGQANSQEYSSQNLNPVSNQITQQPNDSAIRAKVNLMQEAHKQKVAASSSGVRSHGAELKREVHAEQEKGVIRRVGGKSIKEVEKIGSEVIEATFGESQQK